MSKRKPAPKQRRDGEGSLFQTTNNGVQVWCASQTYWTDDGKRRFIRGFGSTPTQALQRRTEARTRLQANGGTKASRKRLRDLVRAWRADTTSVEESATRTVRAVENHIIPRIGNVQLGELNRKSLTTLFEAVGTEVGPAAAKNTYNSLSAMLNYAMRQGWIQSNPLKSVKKPSYKPAVTSDDEELIDVRTQLYFGLLNSLRESRDINYYWVLFLSLGLRRAELCGLEIVSFHPDLFGSDHEIIIDRQFITGPSRIVKRTKNGESRRIPLEPVYALALNEWMTIRRNPVEEWAHSQLFPWKWANGTWHGRNTNRIWTDWHRLLDDYAREKEYFGVTGAMFTNEEWQQVRFRPHFIRHISASSMAEAGIDLQTAQGILGHLSPEMTEHYTHILNRAKQRGVKAIARLME